MNIKFNLFPGGKHHALTMSFDDGRIYDRQLVELFNRYGIKGTFHLNSGFLSKEGYITKEEVGTLYEGHEVSLHTVNHPHLTNLPKPAILEEVLEDKRVLESLCGYPIRGMSLPFGDYNSEVLDILKGCGVEYVRTVKSHSRFNLPEDYMEWHPTLHIKNDEEELWNQFLKNRFNEMKLLYIWGHSYEFNDNQTWDMIESVCQKLGYQEDVYYATNIEIKDYLEALKSVVVSQDGTMIFNPSGLDVYVSVDNIPVCIKARQQWKKG